MKPANLGPRPLLALGVMPELPSAWESMPVQNEVTKPLTPGMRYPLTSYRQIGIAEINFALGWRGRWWES